MQQNIQKLSKNEKKFLIIILEKGNIPDIEISKKTGLSKATCSRIRKKLEKTWIMEYIPIIDLDKAGVEVFLVAMFKWLSFDKEELTKKTFSDLEKDPHIIFLANGEGSKTSTVMFLGFRNFNEYSQYFKNFRKKYDKHISNLDTLMLPSKDVIKNDFTEIIKYVIKGGT
jgi:hypothetical protein